jgi:CRP-like cAMP-binding protein
MSARRESERPGREVRSFTGETRTPQREGPANSSPLPELVHEKNHLMTEGRRFGRLVPDAPSTRTQLQDRCVKGERRFVPNSDSWLLDGLDEGEKEAASQILEACAVQYVPAGARRRIGDLAQAEAVLVEDGFLVVRSSSPSGRSVVVVEAGAGSILLAPTEGEHVQALVDTWITVLPLAPLEDLQTIPGVAAMLFRALGSALRLRQETTIYFASVHHVDRVRLKLLQLARDFGRVSSEGIRLELPLTHDLLAEMVGSARETVTRCLDELQRSGFVVRDGHSYTLLISPDTLDAQG